jgi:transcriptional regulator with XRE-family HTH domain
LRVPCFPCSTCVMPSGDVIRTAREALNMTQKQLADRVGLDHTTVSRIERGVYVPPRRTLKALTDAIGEAAAEQVAS